MKRGLVIMIGGTGQGKSTTLAAMVGYRNENSYGHIITVEDPVEYVHEHKNCVVTQRDVGVDTESWFSALKNALRQAPDVILIGEIRDRQTMEYAIEFAETGHLCMATLHANSSNQALDRIVNFFPEERRQQLLMDLSLNIRAFISQRLVPLKNGKGRVAAVEIMLNTPLISDLIFKGEVHEIKQIMAKSRELGMQTFDQHLFELYDTGLIGYEDALRNADSVNELRLMIKLNSKEAKQKDVLGRISHLKHRLSHCSCEPSCRQPDPHVDQSSKKLRDLIDDHSSGFVVPIYFRCSRLCFFELAFRLRGGRWEVCTGPGFAGRCVVLRRGD